MSGIDWGDAPTWIAAVFAGGAAWFAGMTLRSQRRQLDEQRAFIGEQSANLQLEREILRADADDRRRAQARRVALASSHRQEHRSPHTGSDEGESWRATVKNLTEEPIRNVSLTCGDQIEATQAKVSGGVGALPAPIEVLGAGAWAEFETDKFPRGTLEAKRPTVVFTDNAGLRWRLDEHGDLSQVEVESGS